MVHHSHDLRAEITKNQITAELKGFGVDPLIQALQSNYRKAPIDERYQVLLSFTEKLTLAPSQVSEDDVQRLRKHHFDDESILELVQVIAYFNYINRVADGLGVDLEPGIDSV